MTKINDGGYVAPQRSNMKAGGGPYREETPGMSMRQYYAAKALPAIIASPDHWLNMGYTSKSGLSKIENNARFAFQYADAMIAAELTSAEAQN